MFIRYRGKTKQMWFPKDTAVQIRQGSLVMLTDSGELTTARNDSTNDKILGVAMRNDTTTDSGPSPVEVPVENAVEWLINTDTNNEAADSSVGRLVTVDTEGGTTAGDSCAVNVDLSDSSTATIAAPIFITGFISSSRVIGVIAHTAWNQTYDTAM